jgi:hypothetical protein
VTCSPTFVLCEHALKSVGIGAEGDPPRACNAHGQIGMRTPGRLRRLSRPHCPRCKLRLSKRSPVVCPKDAEINCVCCDHCRRECALDAKGSQLKRS